MERSPVPQVDTARGKQMIDIRILRSVNKFRAALAASHVLHVFLKLRATDLGRFQGLRFFLNRGFSRFGCGHF